MVFDSEYWYSFHYSDSRGYLIFCCHGVASNSSTFLPDLYSCADLDEPHENGSHLGSGSRTLGAEGGGAGAGDEAGVEASSNYV